MSGNSYQKVTLENGLRLLVIPMSQVRSVTALFLIGAGSRYETKELCGISHFLEHMAFKGTKKRPSSFQISSLIEGIGGEFSAFTSKDHTGYYIKAAAEHLPLLLDVLSDMLLNSLFAEEEIDRERGVIIEEINFREDTPVVKIGDVFERLLYGKTPLGWDVAGKKEVIKKITRRDFLDYTKKLYAPENCVVVVAGKVGQEVTRLVEKYLGSWEKRPFKRFERVEDKQEKPALSLVYKKTEQVHFCLGVRAYPLSHPDRFALSVLTAILGKGMASRLFMEIREKRGLAYYIRSFAERYQDVGYFVTQAGVDIKRVEEAVRVVLGEYSKIKNKKEKIKKKIKIS